VITVRDITINRFRSIRESELEALDDFSVLAGLNNSGKSNFLRALNLFFTGRPEPEIAFDLMRDYYRGELSAKKRKEISISLHFTLADPFRFRPGLVPVEQMLGRDFSIKKIWSFRQLEPAIYLNDSATPLGIEDVEKINQFLGLVSFRYIPNRVIPTEIIRREQQALRNVLVRRLARYRKQAEAVFGGLQTTAEGLVKSISDDVRKFVPDVQKVRLATAKSLADLAFQFGYRLTEGAAEMDEAEQGSGMQSLLMFETLHLIDRDYFQQFGWKQAAIWAVEEPESSLNTALEARTAHLLAGIAKETSGRLQILGTTHSDLMIQYAQRGYFVDKQPYGKGGLTSIAVPKQTRELLQATSRQGVSRWTNPLLLYPLEPAVLVEGKFDRDFLQECMRFLAINNPPRIVCLADLKGDDTQGGIDRLIYFIKENVDVIQTRAAYAKVALVLDWDAANRRTSFSKHFSPSDPFVCLAWAKSEVNPLLSQTFRGVERFYPDRIVSLVEQAHPNLIFSNAKGIRTVNADDYGSVKQHLNAVVRSGLQTGDLQYSEAMVKRIVASLQ